MFLKGAVNQFDSAPHNAGMRIPVRLVYFFEAVIAIWSIWIVLSRPSGTSKILARVV